jgi:hypothetical protein
MITSPRTITVQRSACSEREWGTSKSNELLRSHGAISLDVGYSVGWWANLFVRGAAPGDWSAQKRSQLSHFGETWFIRSFNLTSKREEPIGPAKHRTIVHDARRVRDRHTNRLSLLLLLLLLKIFGFSRSLSLSVCGCTMLAVFFSSSESLRFAGTMRSSWLAAPIFFSSRWSHPCPFSLFSPEWIFVFFCLVFFLAFPDAPGHVVQSKFTKRKEKTTTNNNSNK